jgi:hypothetical protein
VGLNLLVLSLAFSYVSAVDYSLMILAPEKGSLAELTKKLGQNLAPTGANPTEGAQPAEPDSTTHATSGEVEKPSESRD